MKIESSSLSMQTSHASQHEWSLQESLVTSSRARQQATATHVTLASQELTSSLVTISDTGNTVQSSEANALQAGLEASDKNPILQLLRTLIAMLTGHEVRVFNASDLAADATPPTSGSATTPAAASSGGSGLFYQRSQSYTESEQTRFSAQGTIRTSDGQQINFSMTLSMARHYHEESTTRISLGTAQTEDPLMINFGGSAAQLTSQRFAFDLNADGQTENINFAGQGSGFLALDRNGDGKINDGTELFGAKSGNGFADLAQLDSDSNGWIDENDAAYAQLRVWTKDSAGNDRLSTLSQADVGALSLSHSATPFSIKDSNNDLIAQIQSSGIFLHNSGKLGTLQQVDLTV